MTSQDDLRRLSRTELLERAEGAGVARARTLSDAELIDEILKRGESDADRAGGRGWLGRARALVANVVERGLHLPEAAKMLRGSPVPPAPPPPPPLPTVTLAEIYVAQGHYSKAVKVLDQVLARDPEHAEAVRMRASLLDRPTQPGTSAARRGVDADVELAGGEPAGAAASAAADEPPADASAEPLDDGDNVSHHDELVALATDPRSVYVYWELRPVTFARAQWREPTGKLVLRVLNVAPGETETESTTRDVDIPDLVGDHFVRGLLPGSEVRLCLGWLGRAGFDPLAVARELQMPRNYPAPVLAEDSADPHVAAVLRAEAAARSRGEAGGAVSRAAARLRGYAAEPRGAPAAVQLPDAQIVSGRRVIRLWGETETVTQDEIELFGGASDMARVTRTARRGEARFGGASDMYGGASDMYGGASDLAAGRAVEPVDEAAPPSSSK